MAKLPLFLAKFIMFIFHNIIKFTGILWRFTRPHTFIGTIVSVSSLFFLANNYTHVNEYNFMLLLVTLISSLGCNLFITGINQWADVENDKINKPYLPIASGELTKAQGLNICLIGLAISLTTALFVSGFLFFLIATIAGIGAAYSLPPIKFKKHHIWAALSIVTVRGLLVNIGFFNLFYSANTGLYAIPPIIIILSTLMVVFSIAIAWFKDIPDRNGDLQFEIRTLTIAYSPKIAFLSGVMLVLFTLLSLSAGFWFGFVLPIIPNLAFAQLGIALLFFAAALLTKTSNLVSMRRFYLFFWVLFFAEYILFPLCLL